MARFTIYSPTGTALYTGTPTFTGQYLKPGLLEFREVALPALVDLVPGCYVDYTRTGHRYRIYTVPQLKKQARSNSYGGAFVYQSVQFFDDSKQLEICPFRDLVPDDNRVHFSTQPAIAVFDNVAGIAERLQECLVDMYGANSWAVRVATVNDDGISQDLANLMDEDRDFSVSGVSILGALDKIYEVWPDVGWVFKIENNKNTIIIGGAGLSSTASYEYGKGNGLKSITRTVANADELATRIFAYGSSRNMLPRWYNSQDIKDDDSVDIQNLMIPISYWGKTLYEGELKPDAAKAYIDAPSAVMNRLGLRPKTYYFDGTGDLPEIYPTIREMTIDEVRAAKEYDTTRPNYPKTTIYTNGNQRVDTILSAPASFDSGLAGDTGKQSVDTQQDAVTVSATGTFEAGAKSMSYVLFYKSFTIPESGRLDMKALLSLTGSITFSGSLTNASARIHMTVAPVGMNTTSSSAELIQDGNSFAFGDLTVALPTGTVTANNGVMVACSVEVVADASDTNRTYTISTAGNLNFSFSRYRAKTFTLGIRQIGFNIEEQANLGDGKTIAMRSGKCAGRAFTIKSCSYVEATDSWSLEVIRSQDDSLSQWFPNTDYPILVNDEFVLLDIAMPDEYILVAENRLLDAAQELLDDVSVERWQYTPEIDAKFMVENSRTLLPAQNMVLTDSDIVGVSPVSVLIDSVTINEGEAAIPTYKVTLRDRKKKTFTEAKGADGITSNPVTKTSATSDSSSSGASIPNGTIELLNEGVDSTNRAWSALVLAGYIDEELLPVSISLSSLGGRVASIEDWLTAPSFEELYAGVINADEINLGGNILDWFVPETYTLSGVTRHRLRLNPKYDGMYADGWVVAGGVGSGGGGGGGGGGLIQTVYGVSDLGSLYSGTEDLTTTFSAKAIDTIYHGLQNTYTKSQVDSLIGAISSFKYEIYASTSAVTNPSPNVLYLIGPTGSGADKYEEYVYANSTWTKIGDTSIDLSNYVQKVSGATNGNFAGLDANGNVTDSGHSHADYLTALGISGDFLSYTKNGSATNLTIPYATVASKTRFTPSYTGATEIEPLLDWFVPETYTENSVTKYRLRLNPKYAGMYADGFVVAGGVGSGGGGSSDFDLSRMWDSLTNSIPDEYASTKINIAHIPSITKSMISDFPTSWAWVDITNKPTTLAGYGITDAYTKSEVDALIDGIDGSVLPLAEGIAGLTGRVVSLEDWLLAPSFDELYASLVSADEVNIGGLTLNEDTIFSELENSGNAISITIAGVQRTLTVGYATKALGDKNGNDIYATYVSGVAIGTGEQENNVLVTKNGTTTALTIPYALKALGDKNGNDIYATYVSGVAVGTGAQKDNLLITKAGSTAPITVPYALVAPTTRFTYTADQTTHTDAEFPIDWFVPEAYTVSGNTYYRLRLNPKYSGMYADGFVTAGGVGEGASGELDLERMWKSLTNEITDDYATTAIHINHIPNITVSKITDFPSTWAWSAITGKPTDLSGYGITDGVNAVAFTGEGNVLTNASVSGHTLTLTKGATAMTEEGMLPISEAIAANSGRITSIEDWILAPAMDELYASVVNADEVNVGGLVLTENEGVLSMDGVDLFSALSSSSSTNLSATVGGKQLTVSEVYATYLGGVTKAGLLTGVSSSQATNLSVTVGGTTLSTTEVYATYLDGTTKAGLFTELDSTTTDPLVVTIGGTQKKLAALVATRFKDGVTFWGAQNLGSTVFSYAGDLTGTGNIVTSGRVTASNGFSLGGVLADQTPSILEWDNANKAWKLTGNFYATGFVVAGGIGTDTSSAFDLDRMWASLRNTLVDDYASAQIATPHLPTIEYSGSGFVTSLAYRTSGQSTFLTATRRAIVAADVTDLNTWYSSKFGSVVSGNTGIVTGGQVYSAINTAISSAIKFQGITTTALTDGATTNPITIDGSSYTANRGDEVIYGGREFLWTGSKWQQLGDEESWALKTVTITGTGYITGGGNLEANRTLDLTTTVKNKIDAAITENQTITLSGVVSGSGKTSITTSIANGNITNAMLANSSVTIAGLSLPLGGSITKSSLLGALELTNTNSRLDTIEAWIANPVMDEATIGTINMGTNTITSSGSILNWNGSALFSALSSNSTTNFSATIGGKQLTATLYATYLGGVTKEGLFTALSSSTSTPLSITIGGTEKHLDALVATRLATVSKTAWGQTFWTPNGVPDSISGNISNAGNITPATTGASNLGSDSLAWKRLYLGNGVYFEYDSDNGGVQLVGAGFYTQSYVTAGGVGGGGTSDFDLDRMWASLTNEISDDYANTAIDLAHIPSLPISRISDAETWISGKGYLTENQTITLTGDVTGSGKTSIATTIGTGKVTNAMLAGSIANEKLQNSAITIAGTSVSLGGSISADTILAALDLADVVLPLAEGISGLSGRVSSIEDWIISPDAEDAFVAHLNTEEINLLGNILGAVDTTMYWNGSEAFSAFSQSGASISATIGGKARSLTLASIPNSALAKSSITINGSETSLGGTFNTASITAGTAGTSSATSGTTIAIPYLTMNKYGIVTAYGTHNHTISQANIFGSSAIGSTSLPVYYNGSALTACTKGDVFSAISSSAATNISVTVAGQTRSVSDLYATYDDEGNNIATNTKNIELSLAEGIANANARIVSLEDWLANPFMEEAYINLLDVCEINGLKASFGETLSVGGTTTLNGSTFVYNSFQVGSAATNRNSLFYGYLYIGSATSYINYVSGNSGLHTNVGFYSDSYITAAATGSSSDRRMKDNIDAVCSDRALSVLMQLKPCEWEWNDRNPNLAGKRGAGLVAQDVADVLPFAVMDLGDYLYLNYSVLHAYEIAGLQNHESRIEALEKENAILKEKVKQLEAR